MTLDTITGGIILALFSGLLGLIFGGRQKVTEEDFRDHIRSTSPHSECPVHKTKLEVIEKKIDGMDSKIDQLLLK